MFDGSDVKRHGVDIVSPCGVCKWQEIPEFGSDKTTCGGNKARKALGNILVAVVAGSEWHRHFRSAFRGPLVASLSSGEWLRWRGNRAWQGTACKNRCHTMA